MCTVKVIPFSDADGSRADSQLIVQRVDQRPAPATVTLLLVAAIR
jgi:hypothetical protein